MMMGGTPHPMRLWVTRPEEDADGVAQALRAHGCEVLIAPLLRVVRVDGPPLDLDGVQALLATSANGVRAFAGRNAERALPLLAVGDATAREARAHGFERIESADGDVAALADLARRMLDPAAGTLLHPAASEVAGDLAGALLAAGFDYRREVLYRAETADELPAPARAALHAGVLDGVVAFSPRTGRTLVRLIRQAGLADAAQRLDCFCLSDAVAAAVRPLPWRSVAVAAQPTQPALVDVAAATARARSSSVDSISSVGYFTGTLATTSSGRSAGDGGMSSATEKDQPDKTDALPNDAGTSVPGAAAGADAAGAPPPLAAGPSTSDRPAGSALPRTSEPWGAVADAPAAASADEPPAEEKPAITEPPAAAPARRRTAAWLWPLLALVVLAAIGAGAWFGYLQPRQQQPVADAQPADEQAETDAALSDLEARQARLRQQLEGIAPRVDALERNLTALRQSVDQLATGQQGAGAEAVQQLAQRIGRLESQAATATSLAQQVRSLEASTALARDTASKLATTVLGVGQLAQAVEAGSPYVRQLAAVRALGGDDPEIAQAAVDLEAWAGTGVPTMAVLRAQYPRAADAAARAEPVTTGDSWTDRVADRLASLVSIRRIGEDAIATGGVDGTLATAEAALAGGDLQAAVTALERLDGPSRKAVEEWLTQARAKLAADRTLASLQQRAIARLSSAKG
jgi:uroporphyrinogen-III synthase